MKFDPQKHHRRSIRLKGYDYTQPGAYFVTMVTHQREDLFGEIIEGEMRLNWTGKLVKREWERLANRFPNIELDEFIVMPNHVHGIILIIDPGRGTAGKYENDDQESSRRAPTNQNDDQTIYPRAPTLSRRAPTNHEQFGKPVPGSIPTIIRSFKSAVSLRVNRSRNSPGAPIWQRNYFERVVRNQNELERIRAYIHHNPSQWVDDPENVQMRHNE
jgi:putative transposase